MNTFQKLLIIFGGFMSYLLADGYTYSVGILYSHFLNTFNLTASETSILPGLVYAIPQLSASIICPLLDTYGLSSGSAWGAILMSLGCLLSSFATSFAVLYFTIGILTSFGLQLTYSSALMVVTTQFENSRWFGLVLGITMCGSGLGAFGSNHLLTWLLNKWHWREVLFLESAILLNILISASCTHHLDAELNCKQLNNNDHYNKINLSVQIDENLVVDENDLMNCEKDFRTSVKLNSKCLSCFEKIKRYFLCAPSSCRFRNYELIDQESCELYNYDTKVVSSNCYSRFKAGFGWNKFVRIFKSSMGKVFSKQLWTNIDFLVYVIANGLVGASVVIPWTFLFDYVFNILNKLHNEQRIGEISYTDISWLPSSIGLGSLGGQLLFGLITSQFGSLTNLCSCCHSKSVLSTTNESLDCEQSSSIQPNQSSQLFKLSNLTKYQLHFIIFYFILIVNSVFTLSLVFIPLDSISSTTEYFYLFNHVEGNLILFICFMIGTSAGGVYVLFPQLLVDILNTKLWPSGLGILLTFNGITNLCASHIGGLIYDYTESYKWAFVLAACFSLFALMLMASKQIGCILFQRFKKN